MPPPAAAFGAIVDFVDKELASIKGAQTEGKVSYSPNSSLSSLIVSFSH